MENLMKYPLDSSTGLTLVLALLRDVRNSVEIKQKVMSGGLQCCVMKANLIADPFQIVVAANKAALSHKAGTGVTKNVYTETLFNLSISKNISQSLLKFGVGDCDTDIVVAVLDNNEPSGMETILSMIDGRVVSFETLSDVFDENLISKAYKIRPIESTCSSLVDSIVSRIASSDFVSH